ncbi:MAG: glycosyltransferase family 2 protein [Betaproteobacteria bacterium]|nr:glycosyltransferase family 2 protein [Betaproteobacteria bacterium]
MTLSVIIITRNNEATIRRCVESVAWADEIVVVDSGSGDRTVEICREFTAKVSRTADFPGHGPQKNRALDLATGDWVFSLDSDEWVTAELRAELERAVAAPGDRAAFMMPRRSSFCGRFMRHSGWWPDYVTRLFRRGAARFSEDHTHDRLIVEGRRGRLKPPILHEAVTDLEQVLVKVNLYSSSSAALFHRDGRRASLLTALFHGGWAFFRTYFLRLGFLDGREGFLLAVTNAEGSYYRYAKLMLLAEREKHEKQ